MNLRFNCIVPDCKFHNKVIFAEFSFIQKHLREQHNTETLVQIAYEKGIIPTTSGYHNFDLLASELGKLSIQVNVK